MSDKFIVRVSPEVLGRVEKANTRTSEYTHILCGGDLHQLGIWEEFLLRNRIEVGNQDVYPAFKTAEVRKTAIRLLWEERVEGWWNLNKEVLRLEIATEDEIRTAFEGLPK